MLRSLPSARFNVLKAERTKRHRSRSKAIALAVTSYLVFVCAWLASLVLPAWTCISSAETDISPTVCRETAVFRLSTDMAIAVPQEVVYLAWGLLLPIGIVVCTAFAASWKANDLSVQWIPVIALTLTLPVAYWAFIFLSVQYAD